MRLNLIKGMTAFLVLLLSLSSHSIELTEINIWNSDIQYKRGELTNHNDHIYIALLPSKGIEPRKRFFWRAIRFNKAKEFKRGKLNLLGKVIEHEDKMFVAKRISVSRNVSDLDNQDKWIPITDSTDGYELPDYTEEEAMATLVGVDNNANGIRDDYETDVVLSDLPADVKENAFNSGKAYGQIVIVGTTEEEVTKQDATNALQSLIYAKQCKRASKALNSGRGWRETDFYNTPDRIEAKFKLQNTLYEFVGDDIEFDTNNPDPCNMLKNI